MSDYVKSPLKSPGSPERRKEIVLSEKEVKDIINSSFSKFNFHFQQLNDKYRIKMEDLSFLIIFLKDKFFGGFFVDKRIEELDVYVNQYFDEENSLSSPKKNYIYIL